MHLPAIGGEKADLDIRHASVLFSGEAASRVIKLSSR